MPLTPITLRFSDTTLDAIRRAAETEGISSAEWVRGAVNYTLGVIHGAALAERAREQGGEVMQPRPIAGAPTR